MTKKILYDHSTIEKKWQDVWKKANIFRAQRVNSKKYYALVELTYTSGDLHIGHWFAWIAPDVLARFKRMNGYDVLFPVGGFDGFGLPAENAAIKRGVHPRDWTHKNIENMRKQFETLGPSFDWDKEVITCDPDYYRWTQWLFIKLYESGLAYRSKVVSNWCPECKTVLANEHVENGCCWRHTETKVIQKEVDQWLIKITKYADKLIWPQKPKVDWPREAIDGQNNWIGKAKGLEIEFSTGKQFTIPVWTKFWETIYGTSFLVLAPEHAMLAELKIPEEFKDRVNKYIKESLSKTEQQRKIEAKDKTGVFTGVYAINPVNKRKIPIWIADYVLMGVGTGAVMGVPAHDKRDFDFAKKYHLQIKPVVLPQREYVDKNAKSYYAKRTKIVREIFIKLAKLASENGKKLLVFGGWGVSIQVGQEFREFEDLDICILEEDLNWWKDQIKSLGLKISNMFPDPKNNDKYYFQATKQDVHIDVLTIKVDKDQKVTFLSQKELQELNYSFHEMFEEKEFDEIPIWVLKKDRIYEWKKDHQAEHGVHRWKEQSDFVMMGFEAYEGPGRIINSGQFDGLQAWGDGKEKMADWMIKEGFASWKTTYHLRDWTISRQRYWGAPIPIIYCHKCWENSKLPPPQKLRRASNSQNSKLRLGIDYTILDGKEYMIRLVPEKDLPVTLPYKVDYTPIGKAPLASAESWVKVKCPVCGSGARRETETMDTYVDSSWYFLRYPSPNYDKGPFDSESIKSWLPIDVYFGGPEHILGHTLYARFITKFLYDIGFLPFEEFALKRRHHGVILGPDGYRMSKSRGNVVNPDEQVAKYGADTVRLYLLFLGPHEKGGAWSLEGIEGANRFLKRVWTLFMEDKDLLVDNKEDALEMIQYQHQTIKKLTNDIERLQFNTAVSGLMEYVNFLQDFVRKTPRLAGRQAGKNQIRCAEWDEALRTLCLLLAPFAPHMTEEIYQRYYAGNSKFQIPNSKFESIHFQPWPKYVEELTKVSRVTIPVQIDGKLRATLDLDWEKSSSKADVEKLAREDAKVSKWLGGKTIADIVFVSGRLINFVTKNPS